MRTGPHASKWYGTGVGGRNPLQGLYQEVMPAADRYFTHVVLDTGTSVRFTCPSMLWDIFLRRGSQKCLGD